MRKKLSDSERAGFITDGHKCGDLCGLEDDILIALSDVHRKYEPIVVAVREYFAAMGHPAQAVKLDTLYKAIRILDE